MSEKKKLIIIGGGHNGLVTAFYLAKAGFKPLVLEARSMVGGCATDRRDRSRIPLLHSVSLYWAATGRRCSRHAARASRIEDAAL
jgi:Phytoene dehydrogenase and related proteins